VSYLLSYAPPTPSHIGRVAEDGAAVGSVTDQASDAVVLPLFLPNNGLRVRGLPHPHQYTFQIHQTQAIYATPHVPGTLSAAPL